MFQQQLKIGDWSKQPFVFDSLAHSSYVQHDPDQKDEKREYHKQQDAQTIRLPSVEARKRDECAQCERYQDHYEYWQKPV